MKEEDGGGETDCCLGWLVMAFFLTNLEEEEALTPDAAFFPSPTLLARGGIWLEEGEEFVVVLMLFDGGWKGSLEVPLFCGEDCRLPMWVEVDFLGGLSSLLEV